MNKKVFISSDMEGVAGVSNWDEVDRKHNDYQMFQKIMNDEVAQICNTLSSNGTKDIVVRDAHSSARNIIHSNLPQNTTLISQFNGHIDCMMFGIDESFDFSILHGYHAAASTGFNPLSHTMDSDRIAKLTINDKIAGETTISIYTSALYNVPVAYVCGDAAAVAEAQSINENIVGTATKEGFGRSIMAKHPQTVLNEIDTDLKKAMKLYYKNPKLFEVKLPKYFKVSVEYVEHIDAYRRSFYPNVKLLDAKTIYFETSDFRDFLRFNTYCI